MPRPKVEQFAALCRQRKAGQPLAYLLGEREFFSRRFRVTPDVLIPRTESEVIVRCALSEAPPNARVLELGTGSGALAITLALERADLRITATDVSATALAVAQQNAAELSATVIWLQGNWFGAISSDEAFDMIVSNPPYIATDDEHLVWGDLPFEPRLALCSGPNGLDAIEHIVAEANNFLKSGGQLIIEHGWQQAEAVGRLLAQTGFRFIATETDDLGHQRVSRAKKP